MKNQKDFKEMSFLNHLEELRWLLVRICVIVLIASVVAIVFNEFIFDVIIFGRKMAILLPTNFFVS